MAFTKAFDFGGTGLALYKYNIINEPVCYRFSFIQQSNIIYEPVGYRFSFTEVHIPQDTFCEARLVLNPQFWTGFIMWALK